MSVGHKGRRTRVQAGDAQRLRDYLESSLGVPVVPGDKVDLAASSDAITREEKSEQAVLYLGTHTISRLADFAYFSLITITTVGYGDILPNSSLARSLVGLDRSSSLY